MGVQEKTAAEDSAWVGILLDCCSLQDRAISEPDRICQSRAAGLLSRSEPVLLPFYPRQISMALAHLGVDRAALFSDLDFGPEALADEQFRLSIAQHEAFVLRAMELTRDPHLALHLNLEAEIHTSNLALLTVANSGQVRVALHAIARYFRIITRVFQIRSVVLDPDGGEAPFMELELILDHDSVRYFAIASFALFLDRFFGRLLSGAHLVTRVELAVPLPDGFEKVRKQFPFEMIFAIARTRIFFRKSLLDRTLRQADPQTVRLLTETTERQLQALESEVSLVGSTRALLAEHIAAPPRLDEAARALSLSPRGLRRKLAEAGTSYQRLLDEVRLRLSTRLLTETTMPVASVAYALGFGNASDFARAFKRWTGQPPSTLRQEPPPNARNMATSA